MGFGSPPPPSIRMPPLAAHPSTLADTSVAAAGSNARLAAGAAEGMGFGDTVKTSPQGVQAKATTAPVTLLGQ